MTRDPYARIVERGWRSWLERLALLGLEVSRRRVDLRGEALADTVGGLSRGPVEAYRDDRTGEVVVLAAARWLRVRP